MNDTQIGQAVSQELLQLIRVPTAPPILYHYTTAAGLLGILKKDQNEFWASAVGFSNDSSEGRYATSVGLEVLDNHPMVKDHSCKFVTSFARSLFSSPGCAWEDGYVVSFCQKDNVLSQWRAYGGTASFSIGFRTLPVQNLTCIAGSDIRLVKVDYDPSEQRSRLKTGLDAIRTLIGDPGLKQRGIDMDRMATSLLYVFVTHWACSVKHHAFHEENEWRITVFPSYVQSSPLYGEPPRLAHHPELRGHRGRLLPYVIVKPKAQRFDLESITVGPSTTQVSDKKAVEILKEQLGIEGVKILLSDIPLQP